MVVAVAVTIAVVAGSGSDRPRKLPPTRARVYTQAQACLLTGARGLADPAAVPVWAGMRDASAGTHAKVTYLAMAGEQTAAEAGPYLATLADRKCTVVLTVGAAPDGAARAAGVKYPGTRFVVVGGGPNASPSTGSGGSNVTTVTEGTAATTRSAVAAAVAGALRR